MDHDVRLVQISDSHLFANPEGELHGARTLASLERVVERALGDARGVDALLCSGDIVNDEPGGYRHFVRLLASRGLPVYCVPGNHDDPARLREALARPPFQVGGSADLGAHWRLVLLDSCRPGAAAGHLSAAELTGLDSALQTDRHLIVCVHHQPVRLGSHWLDGVGLDNGAALLERLQAHPRVRVVTFGHVHQEYEARRRSLRLLATPSTCVQFQPEASDFALDDRPPAYRHLTLRADGTVDTGIVWLWKNAPLRPSAVARDGVAPG